MGLSAGMVAVATIAAAFGAGDRPLVDRLLGRGSGSTHPPVDITAEQDVADTGSRSAIILMEKVPPIEV